MPNIQPKRPRQATACEWCRTHKLKCDVEQPSCRNCARRNIQCITINLRNPGAEGRRVEPQGRRIRGKMPRRNSTDISEGDTPPEVTTSGPNTHSPASLPSPAVAVPVGRPDRPLSAFSPAHLLVTDKSRSRRQVVASGSSQYVLVQWLDLFFARCPTWQPIFPFFQQGLAYSVEMSLSLPNAMPPLPNTEQASRFTKIFFTRIHPIFPVLDEDVFVESLNHLQHGLDNVPPSLDAKDYPLLACAYSIFSSAADEEAGCISETGTRYLEGAYFLYAHLVAMPYFTSVQALLLLTLILRNRNKDGASWGTLGQAIRIAQSLGLHRHEPDQTTEDLHSRIWWTAYILERTMELETGRPSAIRDSECDQAVPRPVISPGSRYGFDYFAALIRLAKIQTRVINLLYGDEQITKSIRELLSELGQIDRALLDWAGCFPESIRPGRDLLCASEELHLATYLTVHYHQTYGPLLHLTAWKGHLSDAIMYLTAHRMIALHRPALLSAPGFLRSRINEHCSGSPWQDRLQFSLCLGAASARAILKAVNDLLLYNGPSRVMTINHILLAILVLGIYVTKIPQSLMNNSDIAMLIDFSQQVEAEFLSIGEDTEFATGLQILRQQLAEQVTAMKLDFGDGGSHPMAHSPTGPGPLSGMVVTHDSIEITTDLTNLEESWSQLWNENFGMLLSNDVDLDMMNTYLLGLPQAVPLL